MPAKTDVTRPINVKFSYTVISALDTMVELGGYDDRSELIRAMVDLAWPTFYKRVMDYQQAIAGHEPFAASKQEVNAEIVRLTAEWSKGHSAAFRAGDVVGPRGKALLTVLSTLWPEDSRFPSEEAVKLARKMYTDLDTSSPAFKDGRERKDQPKRRAKTLADLPETLSPNEDGRRKK